MVDKGEGENKTKRVVVGCWGEDGKLLSGRCFCGLSAGSYSNKVRGQSEVERSISTPKKPTQCEGKMRGESDGPNKKTEGTERYMDK